MHKFCFYTSLYLPMLFLFLCFAEIKIKDVIVKHHQSGGGSVPILENIYGSFLWKKSKCNWCRIHPGNIYFYTHLRDISQKVEIIIHRKQNFRCIISKIMTIFYLRSSRFIWWGQKGGIGWKVVAKTKNLKILNEKNYGTKKKTDFN